MSGGGLSFGGGEDVASGGAAADGGFSLDGLMKMFGALGEEGGVDKVAELAAAKGEPPELPPVGAASGTGIPDFPAVGTAGTIEPGAFAGLLDPSQGQAQAPQFGNQPVQIAAQTPLSDQPQAQPQLGGEPTPENENPLAGLTPQQAQILQALNQRDPRTPAPRAARLSNLRGGIQPGTPFAPPPGRPRLSLAQILGR